MSARVCAGPDCWTSMEGRRGGAIYCGAACRLRAKRESDRSRPPRPKQSPASWTRGLTAAEIEAIEDHVKDGSEARQVLAEEIARHRPPRSVPAVVRGRIARKPSSGAVDTGIRDYISMYCTGGPVWPRDCGWALAAQDELRAAHLADELAEVEPEVEAEVVSLDEIRERELEAELQADENEMLVAA